MKWNIQGHSWSLELWVVRWGLEKQVLNKQVAGNTEEERNQEQDYLGEDANLKKYWVSTAIWWMEMVFLRVHLNLGSDTREWHQRVTLENPSITPDFCFFSGINVFIMCNVTLLKEFTAILWAELRVSLYLTCNMTKKHIHPSCRSNEGCQKTKRLPEFVVGEGSLWNISSHVN